MAEVKVRLTKEKETLLITLYGKAQDSRAESPILHDTLADEVVRRIDYDFTKLALPRDQMVGLAMRAKRLDTWTAEFINANPHATVLNLGCGLDSRVYRVGPPLDVAWFDVDYADVIELRRRLLPKREGYRMIGSSVTDPGWIHDLPADRPAIIVAEGLFPYLEESDGIALVRLLVGHFPSGELAFDGYSHVGVRLIQTSTAIKATGATLHWGIDDPRALERLVPGLILVGEFTAHDPALTSHFSWMTRIMLVVWSLIPSLRRIGRLLRYRF